MNFPIQQPPEARIDAIKASLKKLEPNKRRQIEEAFSKVYDDIEEAYARGVPLKSILGGLAGQGLKISPAKFKRLRDAEAKRRADCRTAEEKQ